MSTKDKKDKVVETKKQEVKKTRVEFTFMDRLILTQFFPEKSDNMTILIAKDLKKKIPYPSTVEFEYVKVTPAGNDKIIWDEKLAEDKSIFIDLTKAELTMLKEQAKKMNDEKRVSLENVDLQTKIQNVVIEE